jgi:NitT/TauT family transport system permease protein
MRSTAAMTLKLMVLAEVLAANNGIGRAMASAQSNFRIDLLFAWTVVLVILNFVLLKVIDLIEIRALRWRAEAVVR